MRPTSAIVSLFALLAAPNAAARDHGPHQGQSYADPPYASPPDSSDSVLVYRPHEPLPDHDNHRPTWQHRETSLLRFHIGGAGRGNNDEVTPGFTTSLDIGRGPAGFRVSGTWLRVGSDEGLAQYTGELTLDLGAQSPWRPVVGAGAGLARYYQDTADGNGTDAESLGIGLVRVAIEYQLPVEATDTRAGLGITGALPAIRAEGAPDLNPWVIVGFTIGVGF